MYTQKHTDTGASFYLHKRRISFTKPTLLCAETLAQALYSPSLSGHSLQSLLPYSCALTLPESPCLEDASHPIKTSSLKMKSVKCGQYEKESVVMSYSKI